MKRLPITVAVLCLCAVGLGAWALWSPGRSADLDGDRLDTASAAAGTAQTDGRAGVAAEVAERTQASAPLGRVAGRVIGPRGEVVAGARVSLHRMLSPWPERRLEQIETGYTGEDGGFHFETRRADDLMVEVLHQDLGRGYVVAHREVPFLTIRLHHGFEVSGYVLEPYGQRALRDCVVLLEPGPWDNRRALETRTDSNGFFRFENVGVGGGAVVRLSARHDLFRPATLPAVTIGSGEQLRLQFHNQLGIGLSGKVNHGGDDRRPIAGAEVRAFPSTAWNGGLYVPYVAQTDDKGRFKILGLGFGNLRVEVRHPDFSTASRVIGVGRRATPLVFELVARSEVLGRLNGADLAGTELILSSSSEMGRARVGADGRFAFPAAFSTGPATLEIADGAKSFVKSSWRSQMITVEDAPQTVLELAVGPPSVLRGQVVDARGAPLGGVQVSTARHWFAPRNPDRLVTVTGADGVYVLKSLPVGTANLLFEHEDFATSTISETTANPGETREVPTVTLVKPGIIRGHVTRGGRGLAGASVFAGRDKHENAAVAVSGPDGTYELHHLAPGRYQIMARYATLRIQVADGMAEVKSGADTESVDLTFPAGRQVSGQVVGPDGAPVQDAFLQVTGQTGSFMSTDSTGKFALDVEAGEAELQVFSPDFQIQIREPIGATEEWVQVRLPLVARGAVMAKVLGLPGPKPVTHGVWRIEALDADEGWDDNVRRQRNIAARWVRMSGGQLLLERVPAGKSRFTLQCPGYGPYVAEIDIRANSVLDLGQIRLEPGARVRGIVRNQDGQPVAGAIVHLGQEMDLLEYDTRTEFMTDPQGRFEIGGITPDSHRLVVHAEGCATALVDLRLPEDLLLADPLPVVLKPCSHIEVQLYRADGRPPELALVAFRKDGTLLRVDDTDQDGRLSFATLGPGRYQVSLFGEKEVEVTVVEVGEEPAEHPVKLRVGRD